MPVLALVTDRVTEIWVSDFGNIVEKCFSSFFEIFVYFFKVERIEGAAKQ